jgi:hypothetical protein
VASATQAPAGGLRRLRLATGGGVEGPAVHDRQRWRRGGRGKFAGKPRLAEVKPQVRVGFVVPLQNRRHCLRWFESITRHRQPKRPLTCADARQGPLLSLPGAPGDSRQIPAGCGPGADQDQA